ncbi:MAG: DUF4440 domain-containing protein [Flavobacteriaceae bacterium]|nr:DUF4440 domain-containing protein [Flavobacteriaceae bacterium]
MKKINLLVLTAICLSIFLISWNSWDSIATKDDEKTIKAILNQQAKEWSNGNLEGFMSGYWNSEQLKFIGSKGLTYGWQQTLDNYKKGYPTKNHTGELEFKIIDMSPLGKEYYHVIGSYHLTRNVGNAEGIFSLVFKKIDGEWKIIIDHSS